MKHICCLLINVFYKLFPELIKAGMVYIINMPLYGTIINKQFIPIFNDKVRDEYRSKGYIVRHYKGKNSKALFGKIDKD